MRNTVFYYALKKKSKVPLGNHWGISLKEPYNFSSTFEARFLEALLRVQTKKKP